MNEENADLPDRVRERVELYPFSYFDLVRRRWVRARYRSDFETIAVRYPAFKILGPPEVRDRNGSTAGQVQRGYESE